MMNQTTYRNQKFGIALSRFNLRRGLAFGLIIIAALIAFEIFNFSTTMFALTDLLGDLEFAGLKWATILAIAFCGIDFAGIARLFTPEAGNKEQSESWYLFGAWLLAATMNSMLTWWGVSIALLNQAELGNAVVERETLIRVVPIFVAILVWLIRVLIIGTFSVAGDRLFSQADQRVTQSGYSRSPRATVVQPTSIPSTARNAASAIPQNSSSSRSSFRPNPPTEQVYTRPEPTYHPVSMDAQAGNNNNRRSTFTPNR
jgi:hypothetical protein